MTLDDAKRLLLEAISEEDRESSIVYLDEQVFPPGAPIGFYENKFEMPWGGYVGFMDLDPMADWGHECRYLLIRVETGEVETVEARFPPFLEEYSPTLRVVLRYGKAPEDERDLKHCAPDEWPLK